MTLGNFKRGTLNISGDGAVFVLTPTVGVRWLRALRFQGAKTGGSVEGFRWMYACDLPIHELIKGATATICVGLYEDAKACIRRPS